ncbi:MAG: hypothetical protein V1847_04485 [Candidatus Diapherotrites archaeon]
MIELKKVGAFQKSVNAIASFIAEGNFRFSSTGLSFKAIDPSQIVLVNFSMPKGAFDKYDIEPSLVGIDLVEMNRIVGRALPNDKLKMDISDSEMLVELEGEMNRAFRLPLLDIQEDEVQIPVTKFDVKLSIPARALKEALKDAALFGSSVVISVKGNQFWMEARGSQGTLKTVAKETANILSKSDSEVVSKYSLNFLQNMVKDVDPETLVTLEFKSDAPMKVSYKMNDCSLEFHLAHMIL